MRCGRERHCLQCRRERMAWACCLSQTCRRNPTCNSAVAGGESLSENARGGRGTGSPHSPREQPRAYAWVVLWALIPNHTNNGRRYLRRPPPHTYKCTHIASARINNSWPTNSAETLKQTTRSTKTNRRVPHRKTKQAFRHTPTPYPVRLVPQSRSSQRRLITLWYQARGQRCCEDDELAPTGVELEPVIVRASSLCNRFNAFIPGLGYAWSSINGM